MKHRHPLTILAFVVATIFSGTSAAAQPWETFTLVRLDAISGDSLKPAPSAEPEWGVKLTPAEQAVITQHFGRHPPYHVGVSRSRGFPEVPTRCQDCLIPTSA
jgi:hypothetical protein